MERKPELLDSLTDTFILIIKEKIVLFIIFNFNHTVASISFAYIHTKRVWYNHDEESCAPYLLIIVLQTHALRSFMGWRTVYHFVLLYLVKFYGLFRAPFLELLILRNDFSQELKDVRK